MQSCVWPNCPLPNHPVRSASEAIRVMEVPRPLLWWRGPSHKVIDLGPQGHQEWPPGGNQCVTENINLQYNMAGCLSVNQTGSDLLTKYKSLFFFPFIFVFAC